MKKRFIYLIAAIILILPSIIAVKSYLDEKNAPTGSKNVVSIKIDDINGISKVIERDKNIEELEEAVSFFLDINSKAVKIAALPDSVSEQKPFCVTMNTAVKSESCKYYISTDPSLCYLVSADGAPYQLTETDAAALLSTKYTECLYSGSAQPVLTLSGEFSPMPSTASWSYRNFSGAYTEADTAQYIAAEEQSFNISGGLSAEFDIKPDLCSIKVTSADGVVLFDDTSDSLPSLHIEEDSDITVEMDAKWYEDAARDYYGERTYKFGATVTASASFYALKPSVAQGGILAISANRIADPSKIVFKSEPALDTEPKFYLDGEYAQALLPIPADTEAGKYVFTLSYGGSKQELNLEITEAKRSPAYITATAEMLSAYTDSARADFDALVESLSSETSDTRLFEGYFGTGVGDGAMLARGFGRNIIINNDPKNSYVNLGVDYMYGAGLSITAANAGTVVYSGNMTYTGQIVVIDHGYGLKTWYWNMGETSVSVGDKVERGDKVGTSGRSGFNAGSAGVHVAMSVGKTFVCPYDTWADGDGGILMTGVFEGK
ncbi:MAG: M23 family metallopeptidase [Clostridiales bacterium]|nr:M23 family metallopeptidase [Clostridiales bacterium]